MSGFRELPLDIASIMPLKVGGNCGQCQNQKGSDAQDSFKVVAHLKVRDQLLRLLGAVSELFQCDA